VIRGLQRMFGRVACVIALGLSSACVSFPDAPPAKFEPQIEGDFVRTVDGAKLGIKITQAVAPRAAIIAVHGMNDYSNAYAGAATYWAANGVSTYAYDQRGFGASPDFGRWAGGKTLTQDLRSVFAGVRAENPTLPVFVVGHSMGAAVVLVAMSEGELEVDGVVLAAPGVWGAGQMPFFYRGFLNIAASLAPAKTLTGERTQRRSTDNIEILRKMYSDPLVIKETRMDAILGVVRIMGKAWRASDDVGGNVLFLYGENDEIIPVDAMKEAAARLCGDVALRSYREGWHLLFRDLQAETVWRDVVSWIDLQSDPQVPARGAGPADAVCAVAGV
jgi:alpha-beta hydrolase superfamily lysophospholipase